MGKGPEQDDGTREVKRMLSAAEKVEKAKVKDANELEVEAKAAELKFERRLAAELAKARNDRRAKKSKEKELQRPFANLKNLLKG